MRGILYSSLEEKERKIHETEELLKEEKLKTKEKENDVRKKSMLFSWRVFR